MKHTEKNQFILFEKEDRINHEDLNRNTSMMETVLERKLEATLLVDERVRVGSALSCSFPVDGALLGQHLMLFWEITHDNHTTNLNLGCDSNLNYRFAQIHYGKTILVSYPLYDPDSKLRAHPVLNDLGISAETTPYNKITHFYLYSPNSTTLYGLHTLRIWGIK